MIKEDIHIGDTLWSWNTARKGVVASTPDDDGNVSLRGEDGVYFTEPYYALMTPPASRDKVTEQQ